MTEKLSFKSKLTSGFVALPDPIKAGITAILAWVVSAVIANLVLLLPFFEFFRQFELQFVMALSALVIDWLQKNIPDAWGTASQYALQLVIAVLVVLGVISTPAVQGVLPTLLR